MEQFLVQFYPVYPQTLINEHLKRGDAYYLKLEKESLTSNFMFLQNPPILPYGSKQVIPNVQKNCLNNARNVEEVDYADTYVSLCTMCC